MHGSNWIGYFYRHLDNRKLEHVAHNQNNVDKKGEIFLSCENPDKCSPVEMMISTRFSRDKEVFHAG